MYERILKISSGDMTEIWLIDILELFSSLNVGNEKFISENVVWIKMSGKHKIIFSVKVIYNQLFEKKIN